MRLVFLLFTLQLVLYEYMSLVAGIQSLRSCCMRGLQSVFAAAAAAVGAVGAVAGLTGTAEVQQPIRDLMVGAHRLQLQPVAPGQV